MRRIITTLMCAVIILLSFPAKAFALDGMDMFCFYNKSTNEYLYTVDENEIKVLQQSWESIGYICTLPRYSRTPVYRMLDTKSGQHLYTSDTNEINTLVNAGWNKEGVAFYVDDGHTAPVYRLCDPATGAHQFSGNSAKIDTLIAQGWIKEGIAFYALSTDEAAVGTTNTAQSEVKVNNADNYVMDMGQGCC